MVVFISKTGPVTHTLGSILLNKFMELSWVFSWSLLNDEEDDEELDDDNDDEDPVVMTVSGRLDGFLAT